MYKIMFVVGMALALLFLVISIILFVKNNIAKLIGDVTGWNARKAIKQIRDKKSQDSTRRRMSQSTEVREKEDYITSALPMVDTTVEATTLLSGTQKGERLSTAQPDIAEQDSAIAQRVFEVEDEMMVLATDTSVIEHLKEASSGEETMLLAEEEETTLLAGEETTLLAEEEETTLLAGEETTLLADEEETTLLAGEETTLLADGEETTLLAEQE